MRNERGGEMEVAVWRWGIMRDAWERGATTGRKNDEDKKFEGSVMFGCGHP